VSSNGYHNKLFKAPAEAAGLIVGDPTPAYGYGDTSVSPELRKAIETELNPDVALFNLFKIVPTPKAKAPSKRTVYICDCDTKVSVATKVTFNATCDDCTKAFVPVT